MLMGYTLMFQSMLRNKWKKMKIEKSIQKKFNNGISDLIIAFISLSWLLCLWFIFLLIQFVEAPIRMLVFKGRLIDKMSYWLDCWKSVCNAMR